MVSLFIAAAASVALVYGLRGSAAAEVNALPQHDILERKMADEIVTGTLRGYFTTANPTEMPTYEFPTKSPSSLDFLSFVPTTEPPFYTTLPTKTPSKATLNDTPNPSNKTFDAQKPAEDSGIKTSASKSNKSSKAGSIHQVFSASTMSSAFPISSAVSSSGKQLAAVPSLSSSSQTLSTASQSNSVCYLGKKWHPKSGFRACTNSLDFPENWSTKPHYFFAKLQECCRFVFGSTGICNFEDICAVSFTDTSMMSPSAAPHDKIIGDLPRTPSPLGHSPQSRSSPPKPSASCVCSPHDETTIQSTSEWLSSKSYSIHPPSESRSYTSLPTNTPEPLSPLFGDTSHESAVSSSEDVTRYKLDAEETGSIDFNNFIITSQRETSCSKVPSKIEVCKLECIVTTKLYHRDILIRDPVTDSYETDCPDANEGTLSTRYIETRVLLLDNVDALGEVHAGGKY